MSADPYRDSAAAAVVGIKSDRSHPHSTSLMLISPSYARRATIKVMRELGECIWTAPDVAYRKYADLVLG